MARPFRLAPSAYVGLNCYFVTACTLDRQEAFVEETFCLLVTRELLAYAALHQFAVVAYCLMPDHVHLLVRGVREDSSLLPMITAWRKRTGFEWSTHVSRRLWQKGYWDHTLRAEEQILPFARYIIENPVRAGIVAHPEAYRWLGSAEYSIPEILEAVQMDVRRMCRP